MSVRTTLDEKVDSIKEHVDCAVRDIRDIVIDKCWGYEELSDEGKKKYNKLLIELLNLRDSL